MFLDITDYDQTITTNVLEQIRGTDDNRIEQELNAQSTMEDYLRDKYDVAAIFAQTGSARHKTILRYMLAITLFFLHRRVAPNSIPETRVADYEEAIQWLKDVAKGKINPDLPKLTDPETDLPKSGIFVTSKKPRETLDF